MNAIKGAIKRLEKMRDNAEKLAIEIIESNPTFLANLNRDQLSMGTNANGGDMPAYVSNSKAPKAPGKIQLFDKGKYTKGITPVFSNTSLDMTSTDGKVKFLDPKYPLALGLSPESLEKVNQKVIIELPPKLLAL